MLILLVFSSSIGVYANSPIQKDIYGRETQSSNGKRINYSQSDFKPIANSLKSAKSQLKSGKSFTSNCIKDTIAAKYSNLYSIMGTSIGRNSMHSLDIDNDGIVEIICSASTQTFGSADYWYIMRYNSIDSTCNQIWTSPQYEHGISTIEIVDFNGDGKYSILLGFDNGSLQVYDAITKELIKDVKPVNEQINSMVYADADNDSKKELVMSCENNTYILDANSFVQKYKISKGADYVRVGNIDNDALNEIVLSSGTAYKLVGSELTPLWDFVASGEGYIELSDIDSDSKLEIIYAHSWNYINVYDADTKTTKYTIPTVIDINALLVQDINNDGIVEILYGDGQWGKVHCYNSVTQKEIWSVNNPMHGVTAINFTELNNDSIPELIWGSGWSDSGPDYLYIYDKKDNKLEWRSSDIVGPFYAIATGDVDGDGKPEIVAVSYASESTYESGVILIIDAQTKKLKWKSSGTFLYEVWTGVYDVSIKDIDNDGNNEIIIAAGYLYTGEIWIIDGKNHTIKSSHIFSTDEFYSLTVEDIDNDGKYELIAISSSNLYVIDPSDWSIKWNVSINSSYYSKPVVKCADVNGDGHKEIIVCNDKIQIVNSSIHSIWSSTETNYLNIDTFDFNKDTIIDIIASTNDGHIIVIDGKTKSKISDIHPEVDEILSVKILRYDSLNFYIYSCDGRINYYLNDSSCTVSQYFGNKIAEVEALKLFTDSDAITSLIGTPISVLQIWENFNCIGIGFNIKVNKSEASCDKDDGKIFLDVTGGTLPYYYLWNDSSTLDSLTNLEPGNYSVKVTESGGCIKTENINVTKAYIDANMQVIDEGCTVKGSAHINIIHINPPYTINWSDSTTGPDNVDLTAGTYGVAIVDSKNCKFEDTAVVLKDTVIINPYIKNVSCYDLNDGYIYLSKLSGTSPLKYQWNSESDTYDSIASALKAGNYNVIVTDTMECKTELNLEITQPDEISYIVLVSPDTLGTANLEGKIVIDNITGGTPPYQIYWPMFLIYSDSIDNLSSGEYVYVINDTNNCQVKDTAIVTSYSSSGIKTIDMDMFQIYPNPAKSELFINLKYKGISNFNFELINTKGQILKSNLNVTNKVERIDLTDLKSGIYFLRLNINNKMYSEKIIII